MTEEKKKMIDELEKPTEANELQEIDIDNERPPALKADFDDPIIKEIIEELQEVYDPEIPVDIYLLGLILRIENMGDGQFEIDMTLTAPGCPVAGEMPGWVEEAADNVEAVINCKVELIWEPAWSPDMMTEAARLDLGIF